MATLRTSSFSVASGGVCSLPPTVIPPGHARIAFWGQSNPLGLAPIADISTGVLASYPYLAAYAAAPFANVMIRNGSGGFDPLEMGVNNGGSSSTTFGPEFGAAVFWAENARPVDILFLEKEAFGGASITNWATYLYDDMVTRHATATAWLASNGYTITTNGWDWGQGEADASQTQAWYQTRLQALIDSRAGNGCMAPTDLSILWQINPSNGQYGAGPAAAKVAIAAATPTTVKLVDYPNYMLGDGIHLSARGQVQIGFDSMTARFGLPRVIL